MKAFFKKLKNKINLKDLKRLITENGQYLYPFMIKLNENEWHRLPISAKRFVKIETGNEIFADNEILYLKDDYLNNYIIYYKNKLKIVISAQGMEVYKQGPNALTKLVLDVNIPQSSLKPNITYIDKDYKEDGEWIQVIIDFLFTVLGYQN